MVVGTGGGAEDTHTEAGREQRREGRKRVGRKKKGKKVMNEAVNGGKD